ncbi:hypothetical protein HRbin12_01062 [bacterium HR12]|nr:hypothetical protein HRbin12_01062 [bacterium HR12]
MTTVFRVTVEDRPGELARLGEALGAAGVNIEGLCGLGVEGKGYICLVVEDAAGARAALEGAGASIDAELEAIVVDVAADADRPGAAGELARKVADAGVNVEVACVATHDRIVLATSDNAKARAALGL